MGKILQPSQEIWGHEPGQKRIHSADQPPNAKQAGEVVSLEEESRRRLEQNERLAAQCKEYIERMLVEGSALRERLMTEQKYGIDSTASIQAIDRTTSRLERAHNTLKEALMIVEREKLRLERLAAHRLSTEKGEAA